MTTKKAEALGEQANNGTMLNIVKDARKLQDEVASKVANAPAVSDAAVTERLGQAYGQGLKATNKSRGSHAERAQATKGSGFDVMP